MPPPWLDPLKNIEKNLDESKHDLTHSGHSETLQEKVFPLGDFRVNGRALDRKLESLMGRTPKIEKKENITNDFKSYERRRTEAEEWENNRQRSKLISSEYATVALKKDGTAWTDIDGYSKAPEAPAFRDGYNNTLRVLPKQEEHLHNGLKSFKFRATPANELSALQKPTEITIKKNERPEAFEKQVRFTTETVLKTKADLIHRTSLRPEISAALASYFVKGISLGVVASKSRDVSSFLSIFRHEHSTTELEGGAAVGEANEHAREITPELEEIRRKEAELNRELGNAFVGLGMTLPAGKRDDPLRNDSVALDLGSRVMLAAEGQNLKPLVTEPSLRKEVAVALGRALLHIQSAAHASRGKIQVDGQKDRSLKSAVGHLTLQLLEATASRTGKTITKDSSRREVLANALGSALIEMESKSAAESLKHVTDRNTKEASILQKPEIATGLSTLAPKSLKISEGRMNKNRDVVVRRPILPGADAPPPSVPRRGTLRDSRDSRRN